MDNCSCNSDFGRSDIPQNSSRFANIASNNPKRRAGRKKFQETRHPVYRGIRRRNGGKWVCEVREPNKKSRIWLGTFPTAEMAARAHDVAAMTLKGPSACLNFTDSPWVLPIPVSGDAEAIQRAAAEAAELFRPARLGDSQPDLVFSTEEVRPLPVENMYVDEEEIFGMPELLDDMAEGLLLYPPLFDDCGYHWDDLEADGDPLLWSHSI